MLSASCCSSKLDPYRAGLDVAEQLLTALGQAPEIVFLFCGIHYQGSTELAEGIYDGLGKDDVIVFGNTGDGFYGSGEAQENGVSALGLHGQGVIEWALVSGADLGANPYATTAGVMGECQRLNPRLIFFSMDFRTDASEVQRAIQNHARVPVVGGAAGDQYQMKACYLYANREVLTDAMVALAIGGAALEFHIELAHSLKQVGMPGMVDKADGCSVSLISGVPALDWIYEQLGRPFVEMDMGVVCLTVERDADTSEVRSLMPNSDTEARAIHLYGAISEGSQVRCCVAERNDLLSDVQSLGEGLSGLGFDPKAALVVSCAGRKQILGDSIDGEPGAVAGVTGGLPMAGYPSFGEFAPVPLSAGSYSENLFHNMSFVALTLGVAKP